MTHSEIHPEGWISVPVLPRHEERAREIRADRDRQYPNIFAEADTDERWVGDLGELVFNSWFKHEGVEGFAWIRDDAAGKPDFVTARGVCIGAKTVKRKVPPLRDYTAQITARHAEEPIDQYFFMSYELAKRRMWLLGGIARADFLRDARYYGAGEKVHAHYEIRPGHEIYNLEIARLVSPEDWITSIA
jgi:hypothetical protein